MQSKIAAFKISRRSITAAVFSGQTLEYTDTRYLANVPKVALDSIHRDIGWIAENFHPEVAALACAEEDHDQRLRVQTLIESAEQYLLQRGIPIWKVTDAELLATYAVPAVPNKHELRQIARSMWPYLGSQHLSALDAASIGLYVQTERLLANH